MIVRRYRRSELLSACNFGKIDPKREAFPLEKSPQFIVSAMEVVKGEEIGDGDSLVLLGASQLQDHILGNFRG